MNTAEALRSIRYDLLEYIQKKVKVDFDNVMQMPVCFTFGGKKYIVHEVLGRFRTQAKRHINAFLVNVDSDEVYFLYFQWCSMNQRSPFNRGFWVLSFRILGDRKLMAFYREEKKMLVNMTLKRVVDFHGHLCLDLAIGSKACEYVQKFLSKNRELDGGISVIAENCTSALDAIQVLLGATVGNQRLKVLDFGKQNYTFSFKNRRNSFSLSLREQRYGDEDEYKVLEEKIINDQASLDEVVHYQNFVDSRINQLLASPPEDLFSVKRIRLIQPANEITTIYLSCWKCGQQVLRSRTIEFEDKIYCIPCFQRIKTGCIHHNLQ